MNVPFYFEEHNQQLSRNIVRKVMQWGELDVEGFVQLLSNLLLLTYKPIDLQMEDNDAQLCTIWIPFLRIFFLSSPWKTVAVR